MQPRTARCVSRLGRRITPMLTQERMQTDGWGGGGNGALNREKTCFFWKTGFKSAKIGGLRGG